MTFGNSRTLKEAKALFAPWCVVMLMSTVPSLNGGSHLTQFSSTFSKLGFFIGIPLLASLSLGNEFRHKTLALLLSQPVDRMTIWREKWMVSILAALPVALLTYIGLRTSTHTPQLVSDVALPAFAWFVITTCSATFWTLVAKSTLGGVVLNVGVQLLIVALIFSVMPMFHLNVFVLLATSLPYAAVMLWLGRRKLIRFQAAGGFTGPDLMTVDAHVLPAPVAALFRSKSNQAILNLIRKELRLLRPLWVISGLFSIAWIGMAKWFTAASFAQQHGGSPRDIFMAVSLAFPVLASVLAGLLSLGEERASGTHAWHLTLPISTAVQWLIKFMMAMLASVVCTTAIPYALAFVGTIMFDPEFGSQMHHLGYPIFILPELILTTILSFWCASLVRGTARAALWVVPAGLVCSLSLAAGSMAISPVQTALDALIGFVVARFQLNPDAFNFLYGLWRIHNRDLLIVPALILGILQSYRLFRRQAQDGFRSVMRSLLPVAVCLFLTAMILTGGKTHAGEVSDRLAQDVGRAALKFQTTKLDASFPFQFTANDLLATSSLQPATQQWLRNSRMTFTGLSNSTAVYSDKTTTVTKTVYLVKVQLAHGAECELTVRDVTMHPEKGAAFVLLYSHIECR